jgi:hypothetical protein
MVQGGCLCRKVRYELGVAPIGIVDCHCADCRKSSGAPFVTWGSVERKNVRFICGEIRRVSVANRIRCFASCCGSPLILEDSLEDDIIEVTIGTLDHPEAFPTGKITWLEDRLPWVVIDPCLPKFQRGSQNT